MTTVKESAEDILGMGEALELLKTTRPTFYRWLREGRIRGKKAGRQWRFTRQDLLDFMEGKDPRDDIGVPIRPVIEALNERAHELGVDMGELLQASDEASLDDPTVANLLNLILLVSIDMQVTDVHISSIVGNSDSGLIGLVRVRLDGVLQELIEFDAKLTHALVDRIKLMAHCDIQIRNLPQDSRATITARRRQVDLRMSTMPEYHGESVTIRFLDAQNVLLNLDSIGCNTQTAEEIQKHLDSPSGMMIVTGPTGCGKTTTLYSCLNEISGPETKIVTIEDPVEFTLPWINQMQVNHREKLTIGRALRAAFRQAPNAMMITEMRDIDTIKLCLNAAMTGHQVFTAMHAEDAASALKRLTDLTGDIMMVTDATNVIVAQRLVRTLCPHCKINANLSKFDRDEIKRAAESCGIDTNHLDDIMKPVGCKQCRQTGFQGRTILSEALIIDSTIINALRDDCSAADIRCLAIEAGMVPLFADGLRKVITGISTLREIGRVTHSFSTG